MVNGWFNETQRHREARLNGKASESGVSFSKGTKFYTTPQGKTVRVGSSRLVQAYPNIMKQFDDADKKYPKEMFEKELEARVKEENKTSKEYAKEGYIKQAKQEKEHAEFFGKEKEKLDKKEVEINASGKMPTVQWESKEEGEIHLKNSQAIDNLKYFNNSDDEEEAHKILEDLEDRNHLDLTNFYGEDYSDPKTISKLKRKLK
jgi:hypothetical protein